MADRPELLDCIVFFEAEPAWVHPEGWCYGTRFTTHRGEDKVIATVAPDEMEFSGEWWQGDLLRARLRSVMVCHWEIEAERSRELLRVHFNDDRVKFCELQLKPHVRVEWAMTW